MFKRIANIIEDAQMKGIEISGEVRPALFAAADNVEHRLLAAFTAMEPAISAAIAGHAYRRVFALLVELQGAVAAFFDKGGVMVMDPDPAIRDNRLGLLRKILAPFASVADFRAIAAPDDRARGGGAA